MMPVQAAVNAAKTRCVRGHAFDEANTSYRRTGGRTCKECKREDVTRRRRALGIPAGHGRWYGRTAESRFYANIELGDFSEARPDLGHCWLWTGWTRDGYGQFDVDGRKMAAHSYLLPPIPPGFEPDHLCYVRNCVKPSHIEIVTKQENLRRAQILRRQRERAAR